MVKTEGGGEEEAAGAAVANDLKRFTPEMISFSGHDASLSSRQH